MGCTYGAGFALIDAVVASLKAHQPVYGVRFQACIGHAKTRDQTPVGVFSVGLLDES
jgi:hypothetical protein